MRNTSCVLKKDYLSLWIDAKAFKTIYPHSIVLTLFVLFANCSSSFFSKIELLPVNDCSIENIIIKYGETDVPLVFNPEQKNYFIDLTIDSVRNFNITPVLKDNRAYYEIYQNNILKNSAAQLSDQENRFIICIRSNDGSVSDRYSIDITPLFTFTATININDYYEEVNYTIIANDENVFSGTIVNNKFSEDMMYEWSKYHLTLESNGVTLFNQILNSNEILSKDFKIVLQDPNNNTPNFDKLEIISINNSTKARTTHSITTPLTPTTNESLNNNQLELSIDPGDKVLIKPAFINNYYSYTIYNISNGIPKKVTQEEIANGFIPAEKIIIIVFAPDQTTSSKFFIEF